MMLRLLAALLILVAVAVSATDVRAGDAAPRPSATEVRHDYDTGTQFVDVRTDAEWSTGHVRSALHLPVDTVANQAATALPDKDKPIVTYCAAGGRAETAAEALRALGYTHVTAMKGGFKDLEAAGFPVDK